MVRENWHLKKIKGKFKLFNRADFIPLKAERNTWLHCESISLK